MTRQEARKVLIEHNTWRRGCEETPQTDQRMLGEALEVAIEALETKVY